jgi:hypothetical protein
VGLRNGLVWMALDLKGLWLLRERLKRTNRVVAATARKSSKTEPLLDEITPLLILEIYPRTNAKQRSATFNWHVRKSHRRASKFT